MEKILKAVKKNLVIVFLFVSLFSTSGQKITPPSAFYGFNPGDDQKLIGYNGLMDYMALLEKESGMVRVIPVGKTEMGQTMHLVFVSSSENIKNLESLRKINKRLALDPKIPDEERRDLISKGKAFVFATLSMHSAELGPGQSSPIMAYQLITDPNLKPFLNEVVFMMTPSSNPDGLDMIVDHYNKYIGTPYEGSNLPGVYHKYIGHNINRDYISLLMKENQVIADVYNKTWHPHILLDKHQMGMNGPRYFVPPNHDPIAQNIDEALWNWSWVIGSNMARDMAAKGLTGVSQQYVFDNYWPGSTETSLWKNVISLLTEAASTRLGSPVFIEPNELRGGSGLADYKKSINMPAPWPGGWWKLGDIVEYEIESTYSAIRTAARQKDEILRSLNDLVRKEVNLGLTTPPYYYLISAKQHDPSELIRMLLLLERHGINLFKLDREVVIDGKVFYQGDFVIPMSQPFRPFIKEVLELQEYPVRRYSPGGEMIMPYDITSWSLPLNFGMKIFEVNANQQVLNGNYSQYKVSEMGKAFDKNQIGFMIFSGQNNESFKIAFKALAEKIPVFRSNQEMVVDDKTIPAGSFLIEIANRNSSKVQKILEVATVQPSFIKPKPEGLKKVTMPRIALVETFLHDMDGGWTRFLFDTYGIPYTVLRPGQIKDFNLTKEFDKIVFPDMGSGAIMQGGSARGDDYSNPFLPPGYATGMGTDGWQKVLEFIQNGGVVISWGRSIDLFTGQMNPGKEQQNFRFPISNQSRTLAGQGLIIPGTHLKVQLLENHPITMGMPEKVAVFQNTTNAIQTSIPTHDMERRVIGRFAPDNVLLSGYADKINLVENMPALVWLQKGKGQVVLFTFNPNFRGSTPATLKLVFNSLLIN